MRPKELEVAIEEPWDGTLDLYWRSSILSRNNVHQSKDLRLTVPVQFHANVMRPSKQCEQLQPEKTGRNGLTSTSHLSKRV